MTKNAFIAALSARLAGLPAEDLERSLEYYSEYIADAMEDGRGEEEAVASLGSPDEIAAQILADIPLVKLARNKLKPQRALRTWEIVLLVLGSPIWLSLIIAAVAIVFSVYVSLWSVVVSLIASAVAMGASAVGGVVISVYLAITGNLPAALFLLGCALLVAGLSILFAYVSYYAVRGAVWLGKKMWLGIKRMFVKKEVRV